MSRGRFITLEGGEGSGKSTQLALLAERLRAQGIHVVETREPGGTPGAAAIRELLVRGRTDRWDVMTEALLHFAARREHLAHIIAPALDAGSWVVCDRFVDSTRAYQGYGQGLDLDRIEALNRAVVGDLDPDLTIVLDITADRGLERATRRFDQPLLLAEAPRAEGLAVALRPGEAEDRYEQMGEAFHARVNQGFLTIAAAHPERCVVIKAGSPIKTVQAKIWEAVQQRLQVGG